MKRYVWILIPVVLGMLLAAAGTVAAQTSAPEGPQTPAGPSFTYQGRLNKNGQAVNDTCSVYVSLWDADTGGTFLGSNTLNSVPVANGLFTVQLDYGAQAFAGQARWIEAAVKCTGDASYVSLNPRMPLTAAPYAMYGLNNWSLTGNSGLPGNSFLGTLDNTQLNIGVNSSAALRIFPNQTSPNIVGGYPGNYISPTLSGATIAGGGAFVYENRAIQAYATVGGGRKNWSDGYGATIAGGTENWASHDYATVAGGLHNYATGNSAAVGGGFYNIASGYVAVVAGGNLNLALSQNATIGGGYSNTVGGGQLIANSTIGGGVFNKATGFAATIAGGHGNQAAGEWSSMGGGGFNSASGRSATTGGGEYNLAAGAGSTIGGGGWNGSSTSGNIIFGGAATIGGGYGNAIGPNGGYGVIGGGQQNQITATAGTNLNIATIGGGFNNRVSLGGATIGGGNSNTASGFDATVGGGINNTASGGASVVPGGNANQAQGYASFAAGQQALANGNGCFVFNDNTNAQRACNGDNRFVVRSSGGVWFFTNSADTTYVTVAPGSGSWSGVSDRNAKMNFASVDPRQVVEKIAAMPITSWSYKAQEPSIRHIGPVAQDFYAAFGVGEDDKHISMVDADGVSLAAIQGLYQLNQEREAQITHQQREIADLQSQVDALQNRLDGLDPARASRSAAFSLDLSTLISLAALLGVTLLWLGGRSARRLS